MKSEHVLIVGTPLANHFNTYKNSLSEELPHYQIEVVQTIEELRQRMQSCANRLRYIVLDPNLVFDAVLVPGKWQNALDEFLREIESFPSEQTITTICQFTDGEQLSTRLKRRLSRKLLALWAEDMLNRSFVLHLSDMVDALDSGIVYMVPHVIDLELSCDSEPDTNGEWKISWKLPCSDPGPFAFWVNRHLKVLPKKLENSRRPLNRKQISRDELLKNTRVASNDELGRVVQFLYNCQDDAKRFFWEDSKDYPPLVHVHIQTSEPKLMAFPIDLLRIESDSRHIVSEIPTVWRIGVDCAGSGGIKDNAIPIKTSSTASCFVTATSFDGPPAEDWEIAGHSMSGIDSASDHCKTVSGLLRYVSPAAVIVNNDSGWQSMLDQMRQSNGLAVCYVLSHGVIGTRSPADASVAFNSETAFVNVETLKRHLGAEKCINFCFLNCCHLGGELDSRSAESDYFGGFLSESLVCALAAEVIAHRWSVPQEHAKNLAIKFFASHPRTVFSRATALYFARKAFRAANNSDDIFWCAPIHAIRAPL